MPAARAHPRMTQTATICKSGRDDVLSKESAGPRSGKIRNIRGTIWTASLAMATFHHVNDTNSLDRDGGLRSRLRACLGATLGAIRTNDLVISRTGMNDE